MIFQNISIKNKLVGIILIVSFFAIVSGFTFVVINDIKTFKKNMMDNTIINAKLIGEYSVTPLAFDDKTGANEILKKLHAIPYIVNGYVYDKKGVLFAAFNKTGNMVTPPTLRENSNEFIGKYLHVVCPLNYKNQKYGKIYLRASTSLLTDKINKYLFTMLLLMTGIMFLSYFLAVKLQGVLSKPILKLAGVTRKISNEGDYSLRVERAGTDEIAVLYKGFNEMLKQINIREKALKESVQKYLNLFESTKDGIVITDMKGKIVDCNQAFLNMIGYMKEEVRELTYQQITPQKWHGMEAEIVKNQFIKKGYADEYEKEYINKNGRIFPVSLRGWLIKDEQGQPAGMWGFVRDITEFKKVEEELQVSEMKYSKLYESMLDGFIRVDMSGRIVECNLAFQEMLGYTAEELLKLTYTDLTPDKWHDFETKIVEEQILKNGSSQLYEKEYKRKDGSIFPVELRTCLITDENSKPAGMWAIVRDITKRKLMEEQIKASLMEKELLLKEIYHRVKNNMQVISSLLNLQAKYIDDTKYTGMFNESQNRIRSMALVHEKLYQSKDLTRIDFNDYINSLANGLFSFYNISASNISLNIDAEGVSLGIDSAIPCGLIINELFSNSLKHAFPDQRKGEINITFKQNDSEEESEYELLMSDNGVGIPGSLDIRAARTLGLQLVTSLAEHQLQGELKLDRNHGTKFVIRFKELTHKKRI